MAEFVVAMVSTSTAITVKFDFVIVWRCHDSRGLTAGSYQVQLCDEVRHRFILKFTKPRPLIVHRIEVQDGLEPMNSRLKLDFGP